MQIKQQCSDYLNMRLVWFNATQLTHANCSFLDLSRSLHSYFNSPSSFIMSLNERKDKTGKIAEVPLGLSDHEQKVQHRSFILTFPLIRLRSHSLTFRFICV